MASDEITWSVFTHEHKDHSADWYWSLGIAAIVGAAISVLFGNILLAVILLVGLGSIAFLAARGPRQHMVRLERRGVILDGTLYPYQSIQSFWVDDGEEGTAPPPNGDVRLFLTTSGFLTPHMSIPLDDMAHAGAVRSFLRAREIPEEEQHPHFAEHLAELLGL